MASKLFNPDKDYLLEHIVEETHILAVSFSILREHFNSEKPKGEVVKINGTKASADFAYELAMYRKQQQEMRRHCLK